MQPLFQAVIDTESAENLTAAFEDACAICQKYGAFELSKHVIQIHKDYALGIEAARRKVFNTVRAVEDYFHMQQRIQQTLPQKLTKQKLTVEQGALSEQAVAATCIATPTTGQAKASG
eukprot:2220982-Karenia_brevis.AAC.2